MSVAIASRLTRTADAAAEARQRLVVVGGGMASQRLLEALVSRSATQHYDITLFSDEPTQPYDRIHLGDVVDGGDSTLQFRDREWFGDVGIELRTKEKVIAVDLERRSLCTETGRDESYDRLILATGGRPVVPPIDGHDLPGVMTYRTLEDAERIARSTREADRALIVGGGLLGLELARSIRSNGCEIEIAEMAPRLLPRQLDVAGAALLQRQVGQLDVGLHLLTRLDRLEEEAGRLRATKSDGSTTVVDFVVFAIGIRPEDALASESGLACHPSGGVIVDDALQTSDPHVFAIGECVRHAGDTYGFVAPCYQMAEALADRLAGGRSTFAGAPISARLKVPEISVTAVGESLAEGPTVRDLTWLSDTDYRRIVLRDGRLVGAIAVGVNDELPRLQEAIARGQRVRIGHERRFAREGRLWRDDAGPPIATWGDAAVVCTCTGVTCGMLRAAWDEGHHSSSAMREVTGAGSGCGTCQPLVAEFVGEIVSARRRPAGRGLAVAACAGLALFALAAGVGPIPMTTSVLQTPSVDFLWRDAWWKQASGFTLVGLMALGMLLPLRDKLPGLAQISFGSSRLLHSTIGVGAIVLAGVHSGLRLGSNLNFVLMASVVGLLALGSMAAMVTSLEHRLPPRQGSALRLGWRRAHVLLLLPVPVLLLFHVLAVYFY